MPPSRCRCAQRGHHPLPHFRRRLARKGDRQDVARRDAGFEQPDVAIDEHARLAGSGGGLQRDVAQRIDGKAARARIGGLVHRLGRRIEIEPWLATHPDHRRSGTRP